MNTKARQGEPVRAKIQKQRCDLPTARQAGSETQPWFVARERVHDRGSWLILLYSPRPAQIDVRASDVVRLLGQEEADNGNGIVGHAVRLRSQARGL